jgi:2-keto-4-pentenoate hydratase/2-oxohepta-3-ene-1,7-dioic acid hydratase in catechol pathway
MRLASYVHRGACSYGAVTTGGVVDLNARLAAGSLRELLDLGQLGVVERLLRSAAVDFSVEDVELLPPIVDSRKMLAVGLNFQAHRDEAQSPREVLETPEPTVFTRFWDSQVGHGQGMVKPSVSERFDYEGELAVVIGRRTYRVSAAEAPSHIAGYSCFNDGTARDWQRHSSQWVLGKSHFHSGAFGPWLVTADEVDDLARHTLTTRVNGERRQHASFIDLIFPIPKLISYISQCTPLHPGDVIATGTPAGVGAALDPPRLLEIGDVVDVECSCVGTLRNVIVADAQD